MTNAIEYIAGLPGWVWVLTYILPSWAVIAYAPKDGRGYLASHWWSIAAWLWPIALPYLALRTIWRRLGKRKVEQDKFGTQIAPGWHLRYDADLADMGRPLMSQRVHDPKPAPYASKLPSGTGGKVDSPWVTREELERDYSKSRNIDSWIEQFAARLDALEAKPEQGGGVVRAGDLTLADIGSAFLCAGGMLARLTLPAKDGDPATFLLSTGAMYYIDDDTVLTRVL